MPEDTQEDPIVCYLIIRESLGMSIGKTAAQAAHGSQMLTLQYMDLKQKLLDIEKISIFEKWINSGIRKVVLKADDKEWVKLKEEFPEAVIIKDHGLTEIEAGSETCIALFPTYKSQRSKLIQRLQTLK